MSDEAAGKLWGGRFCEKTDSLLEKLNASIKYDKRMWREDIQGSQAYARALLRVGLLNEAEEEAIQEGLSKVHQEWEQDKFTLQPSDEDIHTANERRLKELIGAPATKLHTGRSRNDQVATDMRLWLRSRIKKINNHLHGLLKVLIERAKTEVGILMPGYTHLQRAQPVQWSHWLLSHAWNFKVDSDRLMQLQDRVNIMPLGSGALAGNPFSINRSLLAKDLGFLKCSYNSMHAVGNRDFIAEFLFWASLTATHLSRLAEDLILYSSKEFGFVNLSDSYSTGSSLMPQKKNPDSLELIRGRAGRIFGNCSGFMMVMKGLPSTYNKDLQEDKESMFDTYDSLESILQIAAGATRTLTIPFRDAHHLAGEVVVLAEKREVELPMLTLQELKSVSDKFEEDVMKVWDYKSSVEQYQASGGTSTSSIMHQIHVLEDWLLINAES
ncbi:Argininosuccinate lyase [Blattella germanica]|nr:Argininosuccinate lyase [Blattella germanica]